MRVLVCGGRSFKEKEWLWDVLDAMDRENGIECIVHGAAIGADTLAGLWAIKSKKGQKRFPALWKKYGRAAGALRNQKMLDVTNPDLVVAFPGGNGTANMVELAIRSGFTVRQHHRRNRVSESHKGKVYWVSPVGETDDFGAKIDDTIIDGKTKLGPWALMSMESYLQHGVGLGTGRGQLYVKQSDGKWLKTEG